MQWATRHGHSWYQQEYLHANHYLPTVQVGECPFSLPVLAAALMLVNCHVVRWLFSTQVVVWPLQPVLLVQAVSQLHTVCAVLSLCSVSILYAYSCVAAYQPQQHIHVSADIRQQPSCSMHWLLPTTHAVRHPPCSFAHASPWPLRFPAHTTSCEW